MRTAKPIIIISIFLMMAPACAVQFGIENTAFDLNVYRPLRIGLITNQTGLTHARERSVDVLRARGFNVVLLLAPEHGIAGNIPASETVPDQVDEATRLPVMSLYAGGACSKEIPEHLLTRVDVLFFDIQDSGMRHYTYISTLYKALEFCAHHGLPMVVFDRPNPLGGVMEGPLVEPGLISFISIAPIPLRHGLTIGELAQYFNEQQLVKSAALTVVPMVGYNRALPAEPLLAPLSPNIKTLAACFGYSFLGVLGEVYGIFIGARTGRSFGVLMVQNAVPLSSYQLVELRLLLRKYGISSVPARMINKINDRQFHGLAITIDQIMRVSAFNCLVHVLDFLRRAGVPLEPSPLFDKAVGVSVVHSLMNGTATVVDVAHVVNEPLRQFARSVQPYLLYEPAPQVVFLRVE